MKSFQILKFTREKTWAAPGERELPPHRRSELQNSSLHIGAITISTRWQSWRNMSSQPTTRSVFFLGFLHPTVTYLTSRSNIDIQLGRYLQLRIPNCNCSGLCHRNSNNHFQNLNQKSEGASERQSARERETEMASESKSARQRDIKRDKQRRPRTRLSTRESFPRGWLTSTADPNGGISWFSSASVWRFWNGRLRWILRSGRRWKISP